MRSCEEMLELMSAALDGELSPDETRELQAHLDSCPVCSALYAELSGVSRAAGELTAQAPEGFVDAVMDRIPAESQTPPGKVVSFPPKKRGHWQAWAASAAVVALVVLGAAQLPRLFGAGLDESTSGANRNGSASAGDAAAPGGAMNGGSPQQEVAMADGSNADPAQFNEGGVMDTETDCGDSDSVGGEALDNVQNGSANADLPRYSPEPTPIPMPAAPSEQIYCGVLVLTGEPLPPGLEEFASARNSVGELEYTVPAEYYFSNVAELEEISATNFRVIDTQEDLSVDPSAEYGLIIVRDGEE